MFNTDKLKDILNSNSDEKIIDITDFIINFSIENMFSDIHFEMISDDYVLKARKDGIFYNLFEFGREVSEKIISRIKLISNLEMFKINVIQEGRIEHSFNNIHYDIRVSIIPTINGEKLVLRFFSIDSELLDFDALNIESEVKDIIIKNINKKDGIILITGPSGAGKTTLSYAILNYIYNNFSNELGIATIEDPVEKNLKKFTQIEIGKRYSIDFISGLKSLLRQDTEVIFIGEIRDKETAKIAMQASLTGHLIISTLHCKDSKEAILRLKNLDIEDYLINSSINLIINIRLIRKLCSCKKKSNSNQFELFNETFKEFELYEKNGCNDCNNIGFKSRIPIIEVYEKDKSGLKEIVSYKDSIIKQLKSGNISINEVKKYF